MHMSIILVTANNSTSTLVVHLTSDLSCNAIQLAIKKTISMVANDIFNNLMIRLTSSSNNKLNCSSGICGPPLCDATNARILAFSVARPSDTIIYSSTRALCADRRNFFDHLQPKLFFKNGIRIAVMQSTTVITNYYNDQLKHDMEREDRVLQGKITRQQADREEQEWQESEWALRLESIPRRIYVSFLKYHAVVMVMRLYEYIASKYVTEETLDALTIDTFECAKRTASTQKGTELGKSMLVTCWQANTISFLADYSVHQIILAYGYYIYIQEKRRRMKLDNTQKEDWSVRSLAQSYLYKSSVLAASRVFSLGFSSIGGALGTMVWPGWGTLGGINLGDSLSLSLVDDVRSPTVVH